MVVLTCLAFCSLGADVVHAQKRDGGKQKKITNQAGTTGKQQADKSRQASDASKKDGKRIVTPGKDLS